MNMATPQESWWKRHAFVIFSILPVLVAGAVAFIFFYVPLGRFQDDFIDALVLKQETTLTPPPSPPPPPCNGAFQPNVTYLEGIVARRLHGQPLVQNLVTGSLRDHLGSHAPSKALLLSFHGPPGVGKNYISGMIAESMFQGGLGSPYVHHYSATRHFMHKDEEHIMEYKDKLHREIPEKVKSCQHSLFIFDEIDKMPKNLIDTIKPFVEENMHVDGVDYRKTIFLFLSNTAAERIIDRALELRRRGLGRKQFVLKDFEQIITKNALGEPPKKWREDFRCGKGYPAEDGSPAECNPGGICPCCSAQNWCGHTADHCDCGECVDYRNTQSDAPTAGGPHVCSKIKPYPCNETSIEEQNVTCWLLWTCPSQRTVQRKTTCSQTQYFCCDGFTQRGTECVKGTGFWQAELLSHKLVNHVVPFLPLEREQVEMCARDVLLEKGLEHLITGAKLRQISDELRYLPKGEKIQYAEHGCRPVRSKVSMHIKT